MAWNVAVVVVVAEASCVLVEPEAVSSSLRAEPAPMDEHRHVVLVGECATAVQSVLGSKAFVVSLQAVQMGNARREGQV